MVPKESPPQKPPRTSGDPPGIGHPNGNSQIKPQGRQSNTSQQRPSPNTTAREQQQALQVVTQFFDAIPANDEELGPLSREASSKLRPVVINNTRGEPRQIEEALADQGNQPPLVEEQISEPRMVLESNGNVGVVSPNLVNPMTPMSHDLIWPSQLQVRRERLFPEDAIHPNQLNGGKSAKCENL